MKSIFYRAIALTLLLTVFMSLIPIGGVTAYALSNDEVTRKIEWVRDNQYASGSKFTRSYGGGTQCWAYALWLANEIYGSYPDAHRSASNGTISKGWRCYTGSALNNVTLEPGNIVATSGHSSIVFKNSGSTTTFTEVWGSHGCVVKYDVPYNGKNTGTSISSIRSNYSDVRVWKYQGSSNTSTEKPKITMTYYPQNNHSVGKCQRIDGTITSSVAITRVYGEIKDDKGTVKYSATEWPGTTSFKLRSSAINSKLLVNKLAAGRYTLTVTATNSAGTSSWSTSFTVVGTSITKPVINMTSYPSWVGYGKCFGLRGEITGATEVHGYILKNDKIVGNNQSSDYPNGGSLNVRYAQLNNSLCFNTLPRGNYVLKITASNSGGTTVFTHEFTIG